MQRTLRHKQHATLVVVNESVLQTAVPILRFAVTRSAARQAPLVLCTLERPAHVYSSATSIEVIDAVPSFASSSKAVDLTGPDGPLVLEQRLLDAIQRHNGQCDVVLDSVHPLADKGLDKVYSFTKRALSLLKPDGASLAFAHQQSKEYSRAAQPCLSCPFSTQQTKRSTICSYRGRYRRRLCN